MHKQIFMVVVMMVTLGMVMMISSDGDDFKGEV